jgi:C1A family cysteine protease
MMPVRDQEDTPECVAFATAAMREWQANQQIGLRQYLSPESIYSRRSNEDDGMYPSEAMQIMQTRGCPLETSHPFRGREIGDTTAQAANFRINSYSRVMSLNDLKIALTTYGPCIMTFPAYNDSMMFWRQNSGDRRLGGHCVLVVGFDDTQQWFILRNSWGSVFGDSGYCYYPYNQWGEHWECYTAVEGPCGQDIPEVTPFPRQDEDSTGCCSKCILV